MIAGLDAAFRDPSDVTRFTVGRIEARPNSPNTVADRVLFTVDLRHPDPEILQRLGDRVPAICRDLTRNCDVETREILNEAPCQFDPVIANLLRGQATELGLSAMTIPSGAFHDALFLQRVAPTGMVFVPCERGISHHPAEKASPADLAAGCSVLAGALLALAGSDVPPRLEIAASC